MILQEYLDNLQNHQLAEIKYRFRIKIIEDIKNRLCSLLARWDDEEYRETILFTTKEEALYYKPFAENEIRELVVAGIRNSMLEIAASTNCSKFKMPEQLSNKKIQELTSSAIKYFASCDFKTLIKEAQNTTHEDIYEIARQKYTLAWKILKEIAFLNEIEYDFKKAENCRKTEQENEQTLSKIREKTVVCDGYTLDFDEYLQEVLGDVIAGKSDAFYVDSFKMLSRNFEKILHVIQIILEHDKAFVTCNYYISNGHLEKRKKILKAAHTSEDAFKNSQMLKMAPPGIREILSV